MHVSLRRVLGLRHGQQGNLSPDDQEAQGLPQGLPGHGSQRQSTMPRLGVMLMVAAAVIAADQLSKMFILHLLQPNQSIPIIGDFFSVTLVFNSGAAFSVATGKTQFITLFSLVLVGLIIVWIFRARSLWTQLGLALILGGALGNLIDRFFRAPGFMHGLVVDFISIGWWPVFNLADSAVCIGVFLVFLVGISRHEKDHKKDHVNKGLKG